MSEKSGRPVAPPNRCAAAPDPYVWGNGPLRNCFHSRDATRLATHERLLVSLQFVFLPVGLPYNADLLARLHEHLFASVYAWAGQCRTGTLSKGGSLFAQPQYIAPQTEKLAEEYSLEKFQTESPSDFAASRAHLVAEYNAIHPFRKGNGRAIRAWALVAAARCGCKFFLRASLPHSGWKPPPPASTGMKRHGGIGA